MPDALKNAAYPEGKAAARCGGLPPSVHEEGLEFFGEIEGGFEEDGLGFELLAEGGAVAGVFGHELAFHAALVLEEEAGAAFGIQIDPAVGGLEVFFLEDLVAEAIEGEGLGEDGAERFHEVEGKGPAAILRDVEEAGSGIETMGMEEGGDFVIKEGGAEGEAGIDGIVRGAAGAALEGEFHREESGPDFKIPGSGGPFAAAQLLHTAAPGGGAEHGLEAGESGPEVGFAVGGHALEDAALVVDFGSGEAAGQFKDEWAIKVPLVLPQAAAPVIVDGGLEGPEETALMVEKCEGDFPAEKGGDGLAGELGGLSGDDAVEIAQREVAQLNGAGAAGGVRAGDDEALGFQVDAAAGLIDDGGGHGRTSAADEGGARQGTSWEVGKRAVAFPSG